MPDQVEAAAYFVVSECLANIAKHAQAGSATVSVTPVNGELLVSVGDDGVGGASTADGSGLQGLEDRVGALDGTLEVESTPVGAPACSPASRSRSVSRRSASARCRTAC